VFIREIYKNLGGIPVRTVACICGAIYSSVHCLTERGSHTILGAQVTCGSSPSPFCAFVGLVRGGSD